MAKKKQEEAIEATKALENQNKAISNFELPDLSKKKASPIDLSYEYWTPLTSGESKRCFIVGIEEVELPDIKNPLVKKRLEAVHILEQTSEGNYKGFQNSSTLLVDTFKELVENGTCEYMKSGFEITYQGKRKNKGNSFSCDSWSVRPLID